jgi:hypothetical protein
MARIIDDYIIWSCIIQDCLSEVRSANFLEEMLALLLRMCLYVCMRVRSYSMMQWRLVAKISGDAALENF